MQLVEAYEGLANAVAGSSTTVCPSLKRAKELIASSGDTFLDRSSLGGAYKQSQKDAEALLEGEALCERLASRIVDGALREIANKGPIWKEAHSKQMQKRRQAKRAELAKKAELDARRKLQAKQPAGSALKLIQAKKDGVVEAPPKDVQDEGAAKSTIPIFEFLGASVSNEVANIKNEYEAKFGDLPKPSVTQAVDGTRELISHQLSSLLASLGPTQRSLTEGEKPDPFDLPVEEEGAEEKDGDGGENALMAKMLDKIAPLLAVGDFVAPEQQEEEVRKEERAKPEQEEGAAQDDVDAEVAQVPALDLAPVVVVKEPTYKSFKGRKTPRLGEPLLKRMEALLDINEVVSEIKPDGVELSSPRVS